MPQINILSPHVADLIAAGEVVERPASVIKELMENSIDALASNITVEIRRGGATYIRVTDDGCGMAPEDAGVAFLRHATSKLSDESGLESISTMGFRGEALAAISAVSRIELKTRREKDREGCFVTLEAGDIQDMGACGCPKGSTMIVRDLFYNTPARLKFLKSDRAEAAACQQAALRCALGHPEVSVRFIKDGEEEFFSPGDSRLDSAIYALLGRETAAGLLPVKAKDGDMAVRGYISSPAACRGSRSAQYFYCNGRFIRSALLQAAVEQAYKNTLLTGRFPACVLFLELNYSGVDVNVHPAKTEVKFSYEKAIFELVYQAVKLSLEGEGPAAASKKSTGSSPVQKSVPAPAMPHSAEAKPAAPVYPQSRGEISFKYGFDPAKNSAKASAVAKDGFFKSMDAAGYREKAAEKHSPAPQLAELRTSSYEQPYQTRMELPKSNQNAKFDEKYVNSADFTPASSVHFVDKPVQNVENNGSVDYKIVGEAMKSYIIVERPEELIFIDKHAAHERMIFDRLKGQKRDDAASQGLISPATLRLDGERAELLEQEMDFLSSLGYEIELFGENDYIIRAVPADMAGEDAAASVEEICEKLAKGTLRAGEFRDEILHTVACKAAIKAGWDTDPRELERLVEEVLSGRVRYCPHGRPVSFSMSRKEMDKQFKRIV